MVYLFNYKYTILLPVWADFVVNTASYSFLMACVFVFGLTFINYGLEVKKWQILFQPKRRNFFSLVKAFLSGCTISIFMPYRSGEYIGRITHFNKKYWSAVIISSVRSGLLQLLVTIIFGVLASFFVLPKLIKLIKIDFQWAVLLAVLIAIIVGMVFRYADTIIAKILAPFKLNFKRIQPVKVAYPFLLSTLRYLVFVSQYAILFKVMGIGNLNEVFVLIPVFLLVQTLVPTFFLSEIGLRVIISSYLFDSNVVLIPIFVIYVFNILFPALVGILFLKKWST